MGGATGRRAGRGTRRSSEAQTRAHTACAVKRLRVISLLIYNRQYDLIILAMLAEEVLPSRRSLSLFLSPSPSPYLSRAR